MMCGRREERGVNDQALGYHGRSNQSNRTGISQDEEGCGADEDVFEV
jgi:hypothetical protein